MIGLEAMNFSRAVVAFDVGGIPDWLEHDFNGLLIPEQDTAGLKSAIERLLNNPALTRKMGENGKKQVLEKFSFNHYIDRLDELLFSNSE